jgi:hypothetical protein
MALTWASFLSAFRTDLQGHSDLSSTDIASIPTAADVRSSEGIVMLKVDGGHEFHSMGGGNRVTYRDGFDVVCQLWARVADTSATAEHGAASRTRCETMLDAVTDVLEDGTSTIYSHVGSALVSSWSAVPQQWEDGGWMWYVDFTVSCLTVPV